MPDQPVYPIPSFLSEHAQAVLASPLPPGRFPEIDDTDSWLQMVAGANPYIRQRFSADDYPVTSELQQIAGVPVFVLRGPEVTDDDTTPIYIDIHGGALYLGGGDIAGLMCTEHAVTTGMLTWAVDYRMPPLHPFPAGLDDVLAVYRAALEVRAPADIVIGGLSAGGNLAAAAVLRIKDEGLPLPRLLVLLSPELDLTESGDSFHTLAAASNTLGSLTRVNELYAHGADLADPYLSPLFGDVTGFPPTFLQAGTRDLYLSNTVRMHRKLRAAGVEAELHVREAMPHGGFQGAPEDLEVEAEIRRFLDAHRRT